jgi:GTP-binding protein EngB required for normal cell division
VATKLDKLPASKRKPAIAKLRNQVDRPVTPYSSITGDGRDALWKRLLQVSSIDRPEPASQP